MVVETVGDVGVEGVVVVAAVSAVGWRDQLGMDNQRFAAISGCNLASVEPLWFVSGG